MRRYLLDSGIASDYINLRHGVRERAKLVMAAGGKIGTGTPVLGELIAGIEFSATRNENLKRLERALPVWIVWPFDEKAAWEYGRLRAELRRRGRDMQQVDVQIAAIALSLGATTDVSSDSDLAAIPGLRVENWATP